MGNRTRRALQVGLLGGGFIAGVHCDCIRHTYGLDVEIAGIYDIHQEKSERFAKERGLRAFGSPEALFKEVDVVDICTPPYAHAENIVEAANAGKHIVCEKPLIGYSPEGGEAG